MDTRPFMTARMLLDTGTTLLKGSRIASDRSRCRPFAVQALLPQLPAGCWRGVHDSSHPCGVCALVVRGETSDRQERLGRGAHTPLLEGRHRPPCLVRGGAVATCLP